MRGESLDELIQLQIVIRNDTRNAEIRIGIVTAPFWGNNIKDDLRSKVKRLVRLQKSLLANINRNMMPLHTA